MILSVHFWVLLSVHDGGDGNSKVGGRSPKVCGSMRISHCAHTEIEAVGGHRMTEYALQSGDATHPRRPRKHSRVEQK